MFTAGLLHSEQAVSQILNPTSHLGPQHINITVPYNTSFACSST
jgi:hypothetical protein